ncbi:MAG: hypothetical protein AB7H43_12335, partial [Acidimicrobiia bacterium]
TEAITESKLFEFSFTNRQDAIYTKQELVVDDDGRPRQLPWEDWRPGEDEHTSAWMRATAAHGDAAQVGRVGWSGELGYGVRAAEPGQARADASAADDGDGHEDHDHDHGDHDHGDHDDHDHDAHDHDAHEAEHAR